jgi:hypothetical protein
MEDIKDPEIEEIEILEIDENFKNVLDKESKIREDMLLFTDDEMIHQTKKMMKYVQMEEEYKQLKEKCAQLEQNAQINTFKQNENEVNIKLKEEELIALKTEMAKTRKKITALQSLLQVLVERYGINEIISAVGIPYVKLKEYLQE